MHCKEFLHPLDLLSTVGFSERRNGCTDEAAVHLQMTPLLAFSSAFFPAVFQIRTLRFDPDPSKITMDDKAKKR